MNDIAQRLREHAAVHDACTSDYSDEQRQWAEDLRSAALIVEAAGEMAKATGFGDQVSNLRQLRDAIAQDIEGATNANT